MNSKAVKTAYLGMYIAIALVLAYVESIIPINLGIPGAKIGLPNVVTLFLLYRSGPYVTFFVSVLRIVISGFLFGNMFAIIYSLSGFLLSFVVMILLKKSGKLDMYGVSVSGAVMHNTGQLLMAYLITDSSVFTYFPVLLLAGIGAGIVVGVIGAIIYKKTERFSLPIYSRKQK